jgi:high-affinity nickel-transport protein
VSGVFLVAIGLVNSVVLARIAEIFRRMRQGRLDQTELEAQLDRRGLLNRLLHPMTRAVRKPRHMYPIGLLFGLGFDTATEVSLLVLAGGAAAFALPWYTILVLPILFAAGMSLLDTLDGYFMSAAYGWAVSHPVRKVFYNLVITALSVTVTLGIGTIEILSIVTDQVGIKSGPIAAVSQLDLNQVGFVITGIFLVTWAVALLVWHYGRVEDRWSTRPTDARTHSADAVISDNLTDLTSKPVHLADQNGILRERPHGPGRPARFRPASPPGPGSSSSPDTP